MSLEIPQATIDLVYDQLPQERDHDWIVVTGALNEAAVYGRPIDADFEQEVAEARHQKAFDYVYPVEGTAPTRHSSLRIVRDILTICQLEEDKNERLEGVDLRGGADVLLLAAESQERAHRLWEKGILRIFDQRTNRSMWSVEFDDSLVAKKEPADRVEALTDALVRHNSEVKRR